MGRKKRQFIDKKKSVTFHLEPNAFGDEDAHDEAVVADASTLTTSTADYDRKQWELGELGFPDDGYDYSQHMRTIGEGMFIPAIPGSKSDGSSKEFVPDEKVVIYKKNVQKKQQQKQAPTSSVRDLDSLPTAVSQPLGDAATTVIADDDGELDAELLESMHVVAHDENAAEALQDDFVLLANEGLRNAVSLTEDNLTRAQRAARADYLAEMMSSDDDDDADLFNDPYIDSDADLDEFERIARSDDDDEYANGDGDDNHAYDARSESARGWAGKSVRTAYTRYTRSEAGKTMRSEALQTLDQRFDEFEKQYTDDQIGDLEEEADDIAGEADAALLAEVMNEFLEETRTERVHVAIDDTLDDELKQTTLRLAQQQLAEPDAPLLSATASRANALAAREAPAWDAQSYTSLFSTTENHPSIIDAPRSNKAARRRAAKADAPAPGASTEEIVRFRLTKSGMPIAGLPPRKPSDNDNNDNNDDNDDGVVQGQARPADETRAEKAARKQAVKEARRAARQRKKQSRVAHRHHDTVQANALAHQGPKKLNM